MTGSFPADPSNDVPAAPPTDTWYPAATAGQEALGEIVRDGMMQTIAELATLVRIPSVSWTGFDKNAVQSSADAVARLVQDTGLFETVTVSRAPIADTDTSGQPAVLATRRARNGRPTLLLYAHHDVQPPGVNAEWESPPFEPTLRDGRLYGRGASDDKAGIVTHLAAVRALASAVGEDLQLGLALFVEGEEEFGSRSFAQFLQQHRADLDADVIVVADSTNWDVETPALTVSLRGNVSFTLAVSTLEHSVHSGMFGGAAPDAPLALIRLLNSLWDDTGSVAVAGLTNAELDVPEFSDDTFREQAALLPNVALIGTGPLLSRLWGQPAITVTGIDVASVAHASNTLRAAARARVSVRVAPGQPADAALQAVRRHIEQHCPFGARVSIEDVDLGEPFLVDRSGWAVQEMLAAMSIGWATAPVTTGIGGSIPFIADLVREFPAAQVLVTGVEDPDSRAHSPNESQHLGVLQRAISTEALFLERLNRRNSASVPEEVGGVN